MCNIGKTDIKTHRYWQERMCCLYERVSEHEPRPCSVDWLCLLKAKKKKKGEQGWWEQREDGECDKEQWGETEDSYVLWMRSSGWLWGRSLTPPSAPHATPMSLTSSPQQMIHNSFLCFNGPGTHTGSFLPAYIEACTQVLVVKQAHFTGMHFYTLYLSLG